MSVKELGPAFLNLPSDLQYRTFSFLPLESVAPVSKSAFQHLRVNDHYRELSQLDSNTPIGRLVQREPIPNTPEGRGAFVTRIRRLAIAKIQRMNPDRLQPKDWLKIDCPANCRISDLSYSKMNRVYFYTKNKILVSAFTKVMKVCPAIKESILENPETTFKQDSNPEQVAAKIRLWCRGPNIAHLFTLVPQIHPKSLRGVPIELLQFLDLRGNEISMFKLLSRIDTIEEVIEEGHKHLWLDREGSYYKKFIENIFDIVIKKLNSKKTDATERNRLHQILDMILQSDCPLDDLDDELADSRSLQVVQKIIQSNRAVDPAELGDAIVCQIESKRIDIAQMLFDSGRSITLLRLKGIFITAIEQKYYKFAFHSFCRFPLYFKINYGGQFILGFFLGVLLSPLVYIFQTLKRKNRS